MINGIKPMVSPQTPTPKEPTTNGLSFDDAMDSLLEKIQENYASRYGENHKPSKKLDLSLKRGRKFVKVIEGSSVWGFVSLVDGTHKDAPIFVGDIMKAAGWSAAAKHSRGSIFDAEVHKSFSWTGPNYL